MFLTKDEIPWSIYVPIKIFYSLTPNIADDPPVLLGCQTHVWVAREANSGPLQYLNITNNTSGLRSFSSILKASRYQRYFVMSREKKHKCPPLVHVLKNIVLRRNLQNKIPIKVDYSLYSRQREMAWNRIYQIFHFIRTFPEIVEVAIEALYSTQIGSWNKN